MVAGFWTKSRPGVPSRVRTKFWTLAGVSVSRVVFFSHAALVSAKKALWNGAMFVSDWSLVA